MIITLSVLLVKLNLVPIGMHEQSCVWSFRVSRVKWKLCVQVCSVVITIIAHGLLVLFVWIFGWNSGVGVLRAGWWILVFGVQALFSFSESVWRSSLILFVSWRCAWISFGVFVFHWSSHVLSFVSIVRGCGLISFYGLRFVSVFGFSDVLWISIGVDRIFVVCNCLITPVRGRQSSVRAFIVRMIFGVW